ADPQTLIAADRFCTLTQMALDGIQLSDVVECNARLAVGLCLNLARLLELTTHVRPASRVRERMRINGGVIRFVAVREVHPAEAFEQDREQLPTARGIVFIQLLALVRWAARAHRLLIIGALRYVAFQYSYGRLNHMNERIAQHLL